MFREKYVKDIALITPNDDFLEHLYQVVQQNDKVVHIGEYKEAEPPQSMKDCKRNLSGKAREKEDLLTKKNMALLVAGIAVVLLLALGLEHTNVLENGQAMQVRLESVFAEKDMVLYEETAFVQEENATSIKEQTEYMRKLGRREQAEILKDIKAEVYKVSDSMEALDNPRYFLVLFEDDSYVQFAVDENGCIYIPDTSDEKGFVHR